METKMEELLGCWMRLLRGVQREVASAMMSVRRIRDECREKDGEAGERLSMAVKDDLATQDQIDFLMKEGIDIAPDLTRKQASRMMERLLG